MSSAAFASAVAEAFASSHGSEGVGASAAAATLRQPAGRTMAQHVAGAMPSAAPTDVITAVMLLPAWRKAAGGEENDDDDDEPEEILINMQTNLSGAEVDLDETTKVDEGSASVLKEQSLDKFTSQGRSVEEIAKEFLSAVWRRSKRSFNLDGMQPEALELLPKAITAQQVKASGMVRTSALDLVTSGPADAYLSQGAGPRPGM